MKILFEGYSYDLPYVQNVCLSPYFFISEESHRALIPYVGYFYSQEINDSVFILPKVFIFSSEKDGSGPLKAFGKYSPEDIVNLDAPDNPIRQDDLDAVIFELSTWLYQAIQLYAKRNPHNRIIGDAKIQNVKSNKGDYDETFLDIILSLIRFHKDHQQLFTYISIINSTGNNKIHWGKTISKVQPLIQNDEPFYAEFRNRNKTVNYDEEIIVLFYSVLSYLRQKYHFPVKANLNYPVIRPRRVESMIESGKGTRLLRSIRRKYFTDELVALWKLLYAFFEKAEAIANHNYHEEALLVHSFNMVFEDMVDYLISDTNQATRDLKTNRDDKRIDHIYRDKSLVDSDEIYFIADSKYYKESTDIQGTSLYKQYTYARNIIQYNIDIFNKLDRRQDVTPAEKKMVKSVRYRDYLTEGYNITPNFFIRGSIAPEDIAGGTANYTEPHLEPETEKDGEEKKDIIRTSDHFSNRLFDRDTLVLESYNINFLFVLSAYVLQKDNKAFKDKVKRDFRTHLTRTFNDRYDFYKVQPKGDTIADTEAFVRKYFKDLIGKIYRSSASDTTIWLALENDKKETVSNTALLALIAADSTIVKTTL